MPKVRGDGSVIQLEPGKPRSKCRKWQLRVPIGRSKKTGKYEQLTRVFHGTYTEAKAALREFITEIESDLVVRRRTDAKTVREYSEAWLLQQEKEVAHGTWRKYVDHIKCVNLHLGYAAPWDVTFEDIDEMYELLAKGESPSGKPLSGTYLSSISATVYKMFKQMVKDKVIGSSPVEYAERPKPDTKEKKALTHDEMDDLISKLDPRQPTQLVVLLGIKLGLRRGESHGLSWEDIDFKAKVIHVRHNFDSGGNLRDETKNGKVRDIPLTGSVERDLEAALDHQIYLFARTRRKWNAAVPVVTSKTPLICDGMGKRLMPDASTRWWRQNREALGYPGCTVHEMRHSYRTQLRKKGVPKEVAQNLLGHSSEAMSDLYDHVDMEDMQEAIKLVDW
ncbi:MAG: site-specific integrase [Eggerthellaceae bacterium]|nr:site-specific integrase [Eggerthellaceae bacterium]